MKVPTTIFYLKEKKNDQRMSVAMVKKTLKITCFLYLKKNCKQNLDSYCPDTAGPKYIHFYAF